MTRILVAVLTAVSTVAAAAAMPGAAAVVLEAADGAADGKRKLRQSAKRASAGRENGGVPPIVGLFTSGQLDLALGRTNVIHAALVKGGASESFLERCRKLASYRGMSLGGDSPENLNDQHINVTAAQLDVVDE